MINRSRQVPPPEAAGWLVDLAAVGGPKYVVLVTGDDDAREVLGLYLADLRGALAPSADDLAAAPCEPIGVVW